MNERMNMGRIQPDRSGTKIPLPDRILNVQDAFLNYVRRNKIQVTMFLMNGVKIIGFVSCFDQSTILIKRDNYVQLVFKHAISTISPHSVVNLFEWSSATKRDLDLDDDLGALTKIAEEMKDHV